MKYPEISNRIVELKEADLELRSQLIRKGEMSEGYNAEMEQMHISNAKELQKIIDQIGYPTIGKVGKEGSKAAWMIIQHSISQPLFMKACLKKMQDENAADPTDLAFLSDRIAVFENRPQLYGTQFDWDENAILSPQPYDDLEKVNERRKSLGLCTLQERTKQMQEEAKVENLGPPKNLEKRNEAYKLWRKKVGWIE